MKLVPKKPLKIWEWLMLVAISLVITGFIIMGIRDADAYLDAKRWRKDETIRYKDKSPAMEIYKDEITGEYTIRFIKEEEDEEG